MKPQGNGFILKNYLPSKHKVLILNDHGECLQAVVLKSVVIEKLRPGYRVLYSLVPGTNYVKLADIELVHAPVAINYLNLEFLHQILELCALTIPIGQITNGVFDLLCLITTCDQSNWTVYEKRLLICCLLANVGFYPEVSAVRDYDFIFKISKIDTTNKTSFSSFSFDTALDLLLIKWIVNFINSEASSRLANLFAVICRN